MAFGFGNFFPKLSQAAQFENLHEPQRIFSSLNKIKFLRQIITKNSQTSRLVMWQTDEEIKNFQLEFFLVGEENANFAEVGYNFFDKSFIYFCLLENLKPESLYKFRIICGDRATDWKNLKTCGQNKFQMLVFSDSQCENYKAWQKVADSANKNFPDAEIFLVNGDIVDNGQANFQWNLWFDSTKNLLSEKIFVPVMGNHECYDLNWQNCLPQGYLKNFILPKNDEKNFEGFFYSFDFGAAHFFVLNTQFAELEKFLPKLQDSQNYFFRRDAANTNKIWKIVFMHKDIFDYAQNNFNDIAEIFMPLFDELEIDLVFTGHLHTYRNRGKIFAQKKSPNGTTYILCGRAGDQKYIEPNSEIDEVTAPNIKTEKESFISLEIDEKILNLTCQTIDGEIFDKFSLKK